VAELGELTIGLDRRRHTVSQVVYLLGAIVIALALMGIQGYAKWIAVAALFVLTAALLIGFAYLLPGAVQLRLSQRGLSVRKLLSQRTYAWADITAFGLQGSRWLFPPVSLISPPTIIWIDLERAARPNRGRVTQLLSPQGHDTVVMGLWSVPAPQLLDLLTKYWRAFGPGSRERV
jgi:hypothetical protein